MIPSKPQPATSAGCSRGSEEDVLERVLSAAHKFGVDLIVEITGDCPPMDPGIIDTLVETYRLNRYDYVSNVLKRTYPRGMDAQVFPTRVLDEVAHQPSGTLLPP